MKHIFSFQQHRSETPPEGLNLANNNDNSRTKDTEIALGGGEAPLSLTEVATMNVSTIYFLFFKQEVFGFLR